PFHQGFWCGRTSSLIERVQWDREPDVDRLRKAGDLLETDASTALTELEALADQGSIQAMLQLGWAYGSAMGVQKDQTKQIEWYKRAAAEGSVDASYRLARIFRNDGAAGAAIPWLEHGALRGYAPSVYRLGMFYKRGIGVDADRSKAKALFEQA